MLRISKLTDYGVVLATHLAGQDAPRSVRDLARETGIPQPTVSKVLKTLAKAGLVSSTRGARGGYALARPASRVPISDVIAALEGPIAVTECTDESADPCDYERRCGVRANWQRINEAVQSALAEITLAEMAMSSPPPLVALARDRAEAAERRASATEPGVTEPSVTEPSVTEPSVTEPSTTQPSTTQPGVTQPGVTEPHPVQESA